MVKVFYSCGDYGGGVGKIIRFGNKIRLGSNKTKKKKKRCINISVESCSDIGQLLVSDYVSM